MGDTQNRDWKIIEWGTIAAAFSTAAKPMAFAQHGFGIRPLYPGGGSEGDRSMERHEDTDEVPGEGVEEVASDGGIGPEIEAEGIPVDAQEARPIFDPRLPSQQEVDIHSFTHHPYRNWCPVCIEAKGKPKPDLKQDGKMKALPVVSLDYDS